LQNRQNIVKAKPVNERKVRLNITKLFTSLKGQLTGILEQFEGLKLKQFCFYHIGYRCSNAEIEKPVF